jgi:hypothetical protein
MSEPVSDDFATMMAQIEQRNAVEAGVAMLMDVPAVRHMVVVSLRAMAMTITTEAEKIDAVCREHDISPLVAVVWMLNRDADRYEQEGYIPGKHT